MLGQYRTSRSKRVGRCDHALSQYRTSHRKRVGRSYALVHFWPLNVQSQYHSTGMAKSNAKSRGPGTKRTDRAAE
eukprot:667352-Rhodomonas_salina.1